MDESRPNLPHRTFWSRRVTGPILTQLTQGVTAEKIALTLALGLVCGLFPFVGFTTALCFVVAYTFRLNQPIIHVVNQLLWPVQLPLIAVYVKAGARLYRADVQTFEVSEITRIFWASQREFWARFGLMGLYALSAWLISVPVLAGVAYYSSLPALRKLASTRAPRA